LNTVFPDKELTKLTEAAALLQSAKARMPILRSVSWDRQIADHFFTSNCKEPPQPEYVPVETTPSLERIFAARALIDGTSPVHDWLNRFADITEETAALLSSINTPEFHSHSRALYGSPTAPITDGERTALDLAERLDQLLSEFDNGDATLEPVKSITASDLKIALEAALPEHFGDASPRIKITASVSAKAVAGKNYIKLREDAVFSDLDLTQLLQHEALIHIATGINGRAQRAFPILGESSPGNARTQEGLAVFAEFISGALDPRRFKRLADRVLAIQMSANGANFLELFDFFQTQNPTDDPFEAFENTRRIVRGGLVNGGGPFTKDAVYLQGLLEVHNYLRTAIKKGDTDYFRLLFVGKIDLSDLDAIKMLWDSGIIVAPKYLPSWAKDLRYLLSYLAYSTFLNEINLDTVAKRFSTLFE